MSSILSKPISTTKKRAAGVDLPAVPQVNLLPPEYGDRQRLRGLKRRLAFALAVVLAFAMAAYGAAVVSLTSARDEQAKAEAETTRLLQAQQQYAEVPLVLSQLTRASDARALGMSTEVLWAPYLGALGTVMPAGVTLTSFSMSGATPMAAAPAPTSSLQAARIGTLTFSAKSEAMIDTAAWMDALDGIPGFTDAWVSTAGVTDDEGVMVYNFSSTVGITESAFAHRFAPEVG